MNSAVFRFYAELNDFLSPDRRFASFTHAFLDRTTVKDMLEGLGVPHTEVDLILVNGEPVGFGHIVGDGDRVSVYPVFEGFDIAPVERLRPAPLRNPQFVLDAHLGRLAAYLRMAGFDTAYDNYAEDAELARVSRDEHRILLTRDAGLLKRGAVTHGYFVRETAPRRQLVEVIGRFDLAGRLRPFTRCLRCNTPLVPAAEEEVAAQLPGQTRALYHDFQRCPRCGGVYWKGGHYRRMRQWMQALGYDISDDRPGTGVADSV